MSTENNITFVGIDAHAKNLSIAVVRAGSSQVGEEWQVINDERSLKKLVKRLLENAPGPVHAVYEAGPCGYALQRALERLGIVCQVAAPSLIPVKPGERIKTDRRDARKLATLFKGELLSMVHLPSEEDEALRDLLRARDDAKKDLMAARHRISKMLLRHGLQFSGTKNSWTTQHRFWLKKVKFEQRYWQLTFEGYLLAMEQIEERLKTLDAYVVEAAKEEPRAKQVEWLRCLRGIDTIAAMTILAELHDFRRFTNPAELMAYLGLTPSEYSSGTHLKRGGITKAGNKYARKGLIEAAWHYRHRPSVSATLRKRRKGQPQAVIAIADRAQTRLCHRFYRLSQVQKKPANVVAVAIARELVGFIWAILNHDYHAQAA